LGPGVGDKAFGGGVFVADASAFSHVGHPSVRESWQRAVLSGQIVTCVPVELEMLYGARGWAEYEAKAETLDALRRVPLTQTAARAARRAMDDLARINDGYHWVRPVDALIAACAQEAGLGVLHYDHHYDRLAEVLAFDSRWLAPPGSLK
jgi:predicted nucleic acid-binding protein